MSGAGAAFLTEAQVLDVLAKGFGITGVREVKRLGGESDQNERITTSEGQQLVFKAVRGDRGHLDAQTEVMELLKPLQCCPSSVHAVGGAALVSDDRFPGVWFRVLSYLPGEPLASFAGRGDAALLEDLGRLIGRVGGALEHYDHAALHREGFQWDLRNYEAVVKRWLSCIADVEFQASVRRVFELGHAVVAPNVDKFRCQTLHNDLNTHNILLHGKPYLIDFGDLQYTWRIADPAILIAYSMLGFTTPMAICDAVMRGYKATAPGLSEEVQKCVFPLAALRLCTSAVIAAVQSAADPENKHLTIYQKDIATVLPHVFSALMLSTMTLRSGDLKDDEDYYVAGVKEVLALEGTFTWCDEEEASQRIIWQESLKCGGATVAVDACGSRAGCLTWEVGRTLPFAPPNGPMCSSAFVWIALSYVSHSHRRMGVAKCIYAEVAKQARARCGATQLQLDVYENNASSVVFHLAIGFEHYATVFRRPVRVVGEQIGGLLSRPFDVKSDGAFARQAASSVLAKFELANDGAKIDTFLSRYKDIVVVSDDSGATVGCFYLSFTQEHPYGVSYGRYEYPFVFLDFAFGDIDEFVQRELDIEAQKRSVKWIIAGLCLSNIDEVKGLSSFGFKPYVRVFRKPIAE